MLRLGRLLASLILGKEKDHDQEEKKEHYTDKMEKDEELIDLVFSWSIPDIMNPNLYRNQVDPIPDTFSSPAMYLNSFIRPLLEETHADLRSNFTTLHHAPASEILEIEKNVHFKPPQRLIYDVLVKQAGPGPGGSYEPEFGDLMALTEVKPRRIDDLNRPKRPYLLALVQGKDDKSKWIRIRSSMPIEFENGKRKDPLFAVHLTNLTTNMRIWKALHSDADETKMKMISSVLRVDPSTTGSCDLCSANQSGSCNMLDETEGTELDDSQKDAVLSCIAAAKCDHLNSVKLIWGPPGTGKTKTISSLLLCLLRMKCTTLTCAPTNIAMLGVAKRVLSLLSGTLECETYGLGDILVFGNGKRMKITAQDDVYDLFLDHRVDVLAHCFAPLTGWTGSLRSMIGLLEDPKRQYQAWAARTCKDESEDAEEGNETFKVSRDRNFWRESIIRELKKNKKESSDRKIPCLNVLMTFEEFFRKTFTKLRHQLCLCITGLYTHMPTSYLTLEVFKNMVRLLDKLQELQGFDPPDEKLRDNSECLELLKILSRTFSVPNFVDHAEVKFFCLRNACLVFCTASSSAKMHTTGNPMQLVIIDEAAQLKECESSIPLQLPGLKHAILVGDEKQLPAMVQSKICETANFGRSLFERLVGLGHDKHLLNVQYRMHPSISLFPNTEFYGKQIRDGGNVLERSYKRSYLSGSMFGSYSFIDITCGKEGYGDGHSSKNMVEVSVLSEILSRIHKESIASKQKIRVGCISPYKAQVSAIQERIGKTYSTDAKHNFSVNVRSVDGFQGGEEDLIIISTVRCNGSGSVGFLSNCQRANVALTRAKYCLWILGNAATLLNSGSVWRKLVLNAKSRGCFHNAYEDKSLAVAMSHALVEHGSPHAVFDTNSVLLKTSKWKVYFSDEFRDSMKKIRGVVIYKEVASLVTKLANGWLETPKNEALVKEGISSQHMKSCAVGGMLKLIWTIDVVEETSKETQVIAVWDVLPRKEVPKLAEKLDFLLGNYTLDQISHCLYRRIEGDLTLPMTWPLNENHEFGSRKWLREGAESPSGRRLGWNKGVKFEQHYGMEGKSKRASRT